MDNNCNASQTNLSDNCFVCKIYFDRNLRKSRRRILRERDDLVSPFLYLLHAAHTCGTWFGANDMLLNAGPLPLSTTEQLQQMFACRKCFEKVIKLERDVINFEKEISVMLDQSCDTLLAMDIIRGDTQRVKQLQTQHLLLKQQNKKVRKTKKKKAKVVVKKKKKEVTASAAVSRLADEVREEMPQHHKTKQIFVLAKAQEGDQQQLLLLQVPDHDNDNDGNDAVLHTNLDHHYHEDDNQTIFLSSNAIPVTTCVTVTSEDQVLEVQIEQEDQQEDHQEEAQDEPREELQEEQQDEHDLDFDREDRDMETECTERTEITDDVEEDHDYSTAVTDYNTETNEAVSGISSANGGTWRMATDGVIVVNQNNFKKKIISIEDMNEINNEDDSDVKINIESIESSDLGRLAKRPKSKESYTKRTYSPRSSSPLPAAGESRVVVHLMYGSKQWKRPMEGEIKSIIRDMALHRPEPAGRKIAASDKLCPPVIKNYAKRLVTECKEAARTIRVTDHQDVTLLDIKSFTSEIFQKCPKTANLIKSLIPIEPRDTLDEHGATAVIMGVILYMHSMQSNTLQHILSYTLRRAGCNREGFKALHSLGLTLSYTSILKVMNDIDAKPDVMEKSSLDTIERSINSVVVRTKTELNDKIKKKSEQSISQEMQEPENVVLQFTLPYYPSANYTTTSRTASLTYTTNAFQNASNPTSAQFENSDTSVVYNS